MIGPFRLEAIRRRTATGTAFAAVDEADGRWVELKVLALRGSSAAERERRRRELALRVVHPNLVRILSAGEAGDYAYVATDARSEEQTLAELGRQDPRRAVEIACELARALECLHEHALVHRSLCPDTVLIDPGSNSVRLADLGLAHPVGRVEEQSLTVLGERLADPAYAAPETGQGSFSAVSDLYGLGATLAFCLSGRAPFPPELDGRRPFELDAPEPIPELYSLLRALTEPEPAGRPPRAELVRSCLQALLGEPEDEAAVRSSADSVRDRRARFPALCEEAEATSFAPSDFQSLPLPLAQAAQAAWNARPGLPRRMIAYLLWEGLTRLLAAIGCALLREAGRPLPPGMLRLSFRPSFGVWIGLARDGLQGSAADDELARDARELLFASQGGRRSTLLRFLERLLALRNKSAHIWPRDEEIDLLSRMVELSRSSALFRTGKLVCIESAVVADAARVRYHPLELSGAQGAFRGRAFTAAPGLAPGRLYWRCGRRFLELDPFWIIDAGEVLLLQRIDPQRPRYGALDGSPPRVLKHRYAELLALSNGSESRRLVAVTDAERDNGERDSAEPGTPDDAPAKVLDPFVGRVLGNVYRIVEPVGRGAMGEVYRGWDTRLQREVALKLLVGGSWARREARQRFLSEARVLASVGHPHIVRIFEVGEEAGSLFFVMELLPGPTLEAWLAARAEEGNSEPTSLRQRVRWIVDAARALHAVHQLQVVHRDVKPANLMLDGQGRVRLLDFGLAHVGGGDLTRSRAQLGTPRYMAPEQILDAKRVGPPADIYGLGMTLYALLSGRKPFHELDSDHDIMKQAQLGNLPRLSAYVGGIPTDLDTIVARATHPDESKRYPSAGALADDLERWLEHRPIHARAAGTAELMAKYCRRHPVRALALAMLLVLLVGMGATTFVVLGQKADNQRLLAETNEHLANIGRLYDLKLVEDLARNATPPGDTVQVHAWLETYAALTPRIRLHHATRMRLSRRLQRPGDSEFRASKDGLEVAKLEQVLADLLSKWQTVQRAVAHMEQALRALRQQHAAAEACGVNVAMTNTLGMELMLVPAGRFTMGSSAEETESWGDEQPAHSVTVTRSFFMGRMEVNQRDFEELLEFNPAVYKDPGVPVGGVCWYDAVAFCNVLSARECLSAAYSLEHIERDARGSIVSAEVAFLGLDAEGYRLPTEAEWELACRAGTFGPRYGALERVAWWEGDAVNRPQPGGGKDPNLWGLYDLLGNVAEWCWNVAGPYPQASVDPLGPASPGKRVWRGGHVFEDAGFCRAAQRFSFDPASSSDFLGFRIVRSLRRP